MSDKMILEKRSNLKKDTFSLYGVVYYEFFYNRFSTLVPQELILNRQKNPWQPLSIIFPLYFFNVKSYHKLHGIQFTCIRSSCSSGSTIRLSKKKKLFWLKCAVFGYYTE